MKISSSAIGGFLGGIVFALIAVAAVFYFCTRESILTFSNRSTAALEDLQIEAADATIWAGRLESDGLIEKRFVPPRSGDIKVSFITAGRRVLGSYGYLTPELPDRLGLGFTDEGGVWYNQCSRWGF